MVVYWWGAVVTSYTFRLPIDFVESVVNFLNIFEIFYGNLTSIEIAYWCNDVH